MAEPSYGTPGPANPGHDPAPVADKSAGTPPADQTPAELTATVAELKGQLAGLTESMKLMTQTVQTSLQQQQAPQPPTAPTEAQVVVPDLPEDLEMVSRRDLVDLVSQRTIAQVMRDVVNPMKDDFKAYREDQGKQSIQSQINTMKRDHKDFDQWGQEMATIVRETGVPLQRAYVLARAENPEKAVQMDEQFNPAPKEDENLDAGGSPPTQSMRPNAGTPGESNSLQFEEASNLQWENNAADISAALQAMDSD